MATFIEETTPYEVLMRFTGNSLTGAHFQTITHVYKDGVIFGVPVINPPEQLSLVEGEDGELLSDVLGDSFDSAVQVQTLTEALNSANARIDELEELLKEVHQNLLIASNIEAPSVVEE